jgi:hypothetical protein
LRILSPRPQAFSRISTLFQGNSKEIPRKFQGNSKEIPRKFQAFPSFSKLFQGFPNFFLGRSEGNQGVIGRSNRDRVVSNVLRGPGRDSRPGDGLPTALAIQDNAKSDCRKEIVGDDFRRPALRSSGIPAAGFPAAGNPSAA